MDIMCLSGGCLKRFNETEIKNSVDADVYYKFRKFFKQQIKLCNPENIYVDCAIVNCDAVVDVTNHSFHHNMIQCSSGHKFCIKCKKEYEHEKDACKDVNILLK